MDLFVFDDTVLPICSRPASKLWFYQGNDLPFFSQNSFKAGKITQRNKATSRSKPRYLFKSLLKYMKIKLFHADDALILPVSAFNICTDVDDWHPFCVTP